MHKDAGGAQGELVTARDGRPVPAGPVYQGVCRQIRALLADGTLSRDRDAGLIAATRQLARSLDRASGHGGYRPEYGQSLAAMHAQLVDMLGRLGGTSEDDPIGEIMAAITGDG